MALTRRQLLAILDSSGIRPSRALGQHFVVDPNTVERVVRLSEVSPGDAVVEVGAGLGSLTLPLVQAGAHVTAVEVDRRLVAPLRELVEPLGVRVVHADALALDWPALLGDAPAWRLVSNLPYSIATPLVVRLLEEAPSISKMLVMVQREVGERIAAGPGEPGYGAVSVKVAYWSRARVVGRVPPSVFVPRPKVDSVLVSIERLAEPAIGGAVPYSGLFALVRAGFSQRRKMLRRALAGTVDESHFRRAGVPPDARAEQLDVKDWGRLAECVLRANGRLQS